MEVVYNAGYGGFALSRKAGELLKLRLCEAGREADSARIVIYPSGCLGNSIHPRLARHDSILVAVVKELGDKANGVCACLKVERLPDEWRGCYKLDEYDGLESVVFDEGQYAFEEIKRILSMYEGPNSTDVSANVREALMDLHEVLKRGF